MRRPVITLVAVLITSGAPLASDSTVSYGAPDPATISCKLMLSMLERSPTGAEQQFYSWAQGYFAGRAVLDTDFSGLPDHGAERVAIFQAIVDFCNDNPEATYINAIENLADSTT